VAVYRETLRYLARVPEWSGRWLAFQFENSVFRFAELEPLAHLYPQDRLRGSPLLFYGRVVDSLVRDANQLAGVQHQIFQRRVGAGLRALNPGLVRGTLYTPGPQDLPDDPTGVYLLPETTSDLPPVGGILTRGEGSSLSHIQLLARNLGIPNVVVGNEHLPTVTEWNGRGVVLAVSPGGVVVIEEDGSHWDDIFGEEKVEQITIRPDLEKLDLSVVDPVPIGKLRASDSGRVSGPKGANLGELMHSFPEAVPDGFVIPFGAFRKHLERPLDPGGPKVFDWMVENYDQIQELSDEPEAQQYRVRTFLARLRKWIETTDQGPEFRKAVAAQLERSFGKEGSYGAFIRSDTNVEDLPGFTGAGLNLTVPNVIGFENTMTAIRRVWASPFTERAYGWRQSHMEKPEYVFPAVVVQYSFPSEKSGVMVTADVDSGSRDFLTVAVNEGVGGAVDGQATESLLVSQKTGDVSFLSQATAPSRRVLAPGGELEKIPATGTDAVLLPEEIEQLVTLARDVPERFPSLRDENGNAQAADIEFAFKDRKLTLLQMRPFVESSNAQRSAFLARLDESFLQRGESRIDLDAAPEGATR
jgi:hypothetical protein